MRHFAMTGIVTASMMDSMILGSAIRATPPSARMSAGTRSSAITAHAPAASAIRACSGLTTSIMTPPFSISAWPTLTRCVPCSIHPPGDAELCLCRRLVEGLYLNNSGRPNHRPSLPRQWQRALDIGSRRAVLTDNDRMLTDFADGARMPPFASILRVAENARAMGVCPRASLLPNGYLMIEAKKIIVPLNGYSTDKSTISLACHTAKRTHARIYAIYVIEVHRTLPLDADLLEERERADSILDLAEHAAEELGQRIETEILQA